MPREWPSKLRNIGNNKYVIFILQKGLVCCIEIYNNHTYTIKSTESLRFIPTGDGVKLTICRGRF